MMLRRRPPKKKVLKLVRKGAWSRVSSIIARWHPADIADVIHNTAPDHKVDVFRLARPEAQAAVLSEVESPAESGILEALDDQQLSDLASRMPPDDAADLLVEIPDDRAQNVLCSMESGSAARVRTLLKYKSDTAGGIMTTDVVAMRSDQTVNEAINAIAYMDAHEPFVNANIIDRDGKLTGYIDLWELLREKRRDRPLGDLVHKDFIAAEVSTDQEEVARLMAHYDLSVIPVVDSQGRLVGRITSDDVLDVMRDEASEDIFRLAGSDDAELETESTLKTCLVRLPWLLITLGGGFVTTLILNAFHSHITNIIILASFVPVILAMGGNTGIQSSTLIIRSIALGQFRNRRLSSLLLKEIASGATMGLVSGILIGAFAAALTLLSPDDAANTPALLVAVTVSLALFASMTFAASFGALAPVILEKIKADPAVASGPFVTITNDIVAALIYFGITIAMITGLS